MFTLILCLCFCLQNLNWSELLVISFLSYSFKNLKILFWEEPEIWVLWFWKLSQGPRTCDASTLSLSSTHPCIFLFTSFIKKLMHFSHPLLSKGGSVFWCLRGLFAVCPSPQNVHLYLFIYVELLYVHAVFTVLHWGLTTIQIILLRLLHGERKPSQGHTAT